MNLKMTEHDKNEMLDKINDANEPYEAKMWGTLMESSAALFKSTAAYSLIGGAIGAGLAGASGALSNQYCYLGMTKTGINFVVVGSMDVSEIKAAFRVPYNIIKNVKIKGGLIPGRKVVHIQTQDGNLKLSLMNNAIASDIKGQKEAVEYFCGNLETRI